MSGHTINLRFHRDGTDESTRDQLSILMELVDAETGVSKYDGDDWCVTVHLYDTTSASEATIRALGLVYPPVEAAGFEFRGVQIYDHDAPIPLAAG